MRIAILSGGSGLRLWPLSNSVRSKQFLKLFKAPDGSRESMLMRTMRLIHEVLPEAKTTITTSSSQVNSTLAQVPDAELCIEPCRRDTFAAVCLAASYLHDIQGAKDSEVLIACSSDGDVDERFFSLFRAMERALDEGAELACIGIEPTYPSEKYGYALPSERADVARVLRFEEKPSAERARELIAQGALWNAGVYGMRVGYVLECARELLGTSSYEELRAAYESLDSVSFDYAVAEHAQRLSVLRYQGSWSDLGTWATLADSLGETAIGKATLDEGASNTLAINELGIPLLVMGIENAVVCAAPDGILVADKSASSAMKPYVERISMEPRLSEKSWGSYQVVHADTDSLTVLVTLKPGHHMNYHKHRLRDESWTIVSGTGYAVINGEKRLLGPGDCVSMPAGTEHALVATSTLVAVEVQVGSEIHVKDKVLLDWDFSR